MWQFSFETDKWSNIANVLVPYFSVVPPPPDDEVGGKDNDDYIAEIDKVPT